MIIHGLTHRDNKQPNKNRQASNKWTGETESLYQPIWLVLREVIPKLGIRVSRNPEPTIDIEVERKALLRFRIYSRFHRLRISQLLLFFRSLANFRTPILTLCSVRARFRPRTGRYGIRPGPRSPHAAENLVVGLVPSQDLYRLAERAEGSEFCL